MNELQRKADEIRAELHTQYDVILGSLGRAEKLYSPDFMDCLATLLKRHPKAIFLWFGNDPYHETIRLMEERSISNRCLYQGWVDSTLYGKVLDIHLDSFPFPTGLTMYSSMRSGTASVLMHTLESRRLGALSLSLIHI